MAYKDYSEISIEVDNKGIALMTFDRPSNQNMKAEIRTIFRDFRVDPEVKVIVMTGTGERFLDSSASKQEKSFIESMADPMVAAGVVEHYRTVVWSMIDLDKPLIAAVNGLALGSSLSIAMMADFVFAAENATFCDTHTRGGLAAGDGGVLFWPLLVGMRKAKQYLITGDVLDAREAERIGLINKVVPADQLMPEAMGLARRLADGPVFAMRLTKQSLNQWYRAAAINAFEYSVWAEMASLMSPEAREGRQAGMEGRVRWSPTFNNPQG